MNTTNDTERNKRAHDMLAQQLEVLIDNYGLFRVLGTLAAVCLDKADYVAEGGSHGDPSPFLAKQWRGIAKSVDVVAGRAAGL